MDLRLAAVGVALASPPIVEPILHCILYIRKKLHIYRTATASHQKYAILVEGHLLNAESLVKIVHRSFDSRDDLTKSFFLAAIQALKTTLIDFTTCLSTVVDNRGVIKRLDFTFRGRGALIQLDQELTEWESSLHNVLFFRVLAEGSLDSVLSTPLEGSSIARLIQRCLTAQTNRIRLQEEASLGHSNASPIRLSPLLRGVGYLFELQRSSATTSEVADVASFLHGVDSGLVGLLRCSGFQGHVLRYDIPEGYHDLKSLKHILDDSRGRTSEYTMESRLALMKRLASAVMFVHCARKVHKSIRSENIAVFALSGEGRASEIGQGYLVGFAFCRADAASSRRDATNDFKDAYYLPVDRQGDPQRDYTLLDDIYSLGVVFLEIALLQTFSRYDETRNCWCPIRALDTASGDPEKVKNIFLGLAKKEVPRRMGSSVSELIMSCLSAVDDQDYFTGGSDITNADTSLGLAYIKRVLQVLDTIRY